MLSSRHAEGKTHHFFPWVPQRLMPKIMPSPTLADAPWSFWYVCATSVFLDCKPPGAVVTSMFFCLPPFLTPRSAHSRHRKVFRKISPRPKRLFAYSTSFQRLDGTVARAKSGVFWNSGEEGRETRGGGPGTFTGWAWFRCIAEMQGSDLTSVTCFAIFIASLRTWLQIVFTTTLYQF